MLWIGPPGQTQTGDPGIRSSMFYSTELQAAQKLLYTFIIAMYTKSYKYFLEMIL